MLVVDASVLAPALADDGDAGDRARRRIRGERLAAPELIDLETASVIRRQHAAGALDARRAEFAFADLAQLPLRRASHRPLLRRCWELRENLTVYDAAYVALAELLDAALLTADRDAAYRIAQEHAQAAWRTRTPMRELLEADPRCGGLDLDAIFDYAAMTRYAGELIARLEEID